MYWDCVIYNGEREMLDIRMAELAPLDVIHVLVEGRQTFQGVPKKVESVVHDRVIHHVVDLAVDDCRCGCAEATRWTPSEAWVREAHQRNSIMDVLPSTPGEVVLLGDADEIPSREVLLSITEMPCRFLMDAYFFDYTWFGGHHIPCTVVALREQITTPAKMRHAGMTTVVGGWHLTYMGGVDTIQEKVRAFSHSELSLYSEDRWHHAIETGVVPWTGVQLQKVDRPSCVRDEG